VPCQLAARVRSGYGELLAHTEQKGTMTMPPYLLPQNGFQELFRPLDKVRGRQGQIGERDVWFGLGVRESGGVPGDWLKACWV
jgi:hypothetical protein